MDERAELVKKIQAVTQENMRLRAEIADRDRQLSNVRMLLKHEKYLADRYRAYRRERFTMRGWLKRAWHGMDEAWAVRVIVGTAIMSVVALGIAELFPKILY